MLDEVGSDAAGSKSRGRVSRVLATGMAAALTALLCADPATAAASTAYGQWNMSGQSGTLTVPVAGFPSAQVSSTSSSVVVASGTSAYLNTSTPFGAEYGSSRGEPYLSLRTATGLNPSNTTLTFASPPAPGSWAFALGDVDADHVHISAIDAAGNPVSTEDLGFQGSFNYCNGSPLPSTCGGSTSNDLPRWDAGTSTLIGSSRDTSGASGWLKPRVPIRSVTLRFEVQSGIPLYQLWVAAQATESTPPSPPPTQPPVVDPGGTPVEIVIPTVIDRDRPVHIITPPQHGTISHLPNGNLLYTPNKGFVGTDRFKYRGRTRGGRIVIETVTVEVGPTLADTGTGGALWLLMISGAFLIAGAGVTVLCRTTLRGRGSHRG